MTAREIIQAKTLFELGEPISSIARSIERSESTTKKAIEGNEHLNVYVRTAKMELEEDLKDEVKTIITAKEVAQLKVKETIIEEGAALLLAKIRRHPESIGVKELSGAIKDIFGIAQVEAGKPSDITKLESADPHALANVLKQLETARGESEDESGV